MSVETTTKVEENLIKWKEGAHQKYECACMALCSQFRQQMNVRLCG